MNETADNSRTGQAELLAILQQLEEENEASGHLSLTWGNTSLYRFDRYERPLIIIDNRVQLEPDDDAASWDAAVAEARGLGWEPADDCPDVEIGPLEFFMLSRAPREDVI